MHRDVHFLQVLTWKKKRGDSNGERTGRPFGQRRRFDTGGQAGEVFHVPKEEMRWDPVVLCGRLSVVHDLQAHFLPLSSSREIKGLNRVERERSREFFL